jgi:hypothetical protein
MALICGLVVVVIAQRLAPIGGPPLYDGVVVEDPYKWLSPPPGLLGGAQSVQESDPVGGGGFGVGTPEQPPQAQVISDLGSLDLPEGTTSVTVSIKPVAAPATQPQDGVVAGNTYRISVTDQHGATISVKAGSLVTMLFRGPPSLPSATIESFSGGEWTSVQTDPAGVPDMFTAVVPAFGDYALVAPTGWAPAGARTPPATAVVPTQTPTSTAPASAPASVTAAPSAEPTVPVNATTPMGTPGEPTSGPPIVAVVIALLVVVAAVIVFLRPIKPPSD